MIIIVESVENTDKIKHEIAKGNFADFYNEEVNVLEELFDTYFAWINARINMDKILSIDIESFRYELGQMRKNFFIKYFGEDDYQYRIISSVI